MEKYFQKLTLIRSKKEKGVANNFKVLNWKNGLFFNTNAQVHNMCRRRTERKSQKRKYFKGKIGERLEIVVVLSACVSLLRLP